MRTERFEKNSLIKVAGGGGSDTVNKGNQPLRSKFALMAGSNSSKRTERSAQTFLLRFKVSKISWFFSVGNRSLSKDGGEGVGVGMVLRALVFLGMVLRNRTETQRENQKEHKNKTKGRLQVSTKKYRMKIYMMHESVMMI